MEIRFSKPLCGHLDVRAKAADAGVYAAISNDQGSTVRFTLHKTMGRTANEWQHERVIAALFELDPEATIRTARAIYESKADYDTQLKARAS